MLSKLFAKRINILIHQQMVSNKKRDVLCLKEVKNVLYLHFLRLKKYYERIRRHKDTQSII